MSASPFQQYSLPAVISVLLHVGIGLAMLVGWASAPPKLETKRPNFVQAELVSLQSRTESKAEESPSRQPEKVDLVKKRQEQERQQKLAEQKRQQEIKRKQEAEEKRKQEAEKKKAETERKKEQERKAKEEAKREEQKQLRQQQRQAAFEDALAQEQGELLEASYSVAAQSYMSAIAQRIEQNWSRPPSARNDMQCELLIKLVPTGRVINVDVVKSSGDALFDRSAVQAVKKVEQFPEIKDMQPEVFERYYRELNLVFRPQDLRQ